VGLAAGEIVSGLEVLRALRSEIGMALVLISHDLSVVRPLCEKVVVMQHGVIVDIDEG
jgi:ABC-type microcin C transport system duplicated ATPase subunit YejF